MALKKIACCVMMALVPAVGYSDSLDEGFNKEEKKCEEFIRVYSYTGKEGKSVSVGEEDLKCEEEGRVRFLEHGKAKRKILLGWEGYKGNIRCASVMDGDLLHGTAEFDMLFYIKRGNDGPVLNIDIDKSDPFLIPSSEAKDINIESLSVHDNYYVDLEGKFAKEPFGETPSQASYSLTFAISESPFSYIDQGKMDSYQPVKDAVINVFNDDTYSYDVECKRSSEGTRYSDQLHLIPNDREE